MSQENFIPLVCPNCGGKLSVPQTIIDEEFISKDGETYRYIGKETGTDNYKCTYCNSEFMLNQKVKIDVSFEGKGNLSINTNGGAYIVGNVTTKGDFVGRNKTTKIITTMIKD
jgi:DNA-directed RNA polymerase subunit RPC12/RpoP